MKLSRGQNFLICLPDIDRGGVRGLTVRTVVDKRSHRNPRRQLGNSAAVIDMEMGNQHVVDLADPGFLRRRNDPIRISAVIVRPARVDQKRLICGRNKQRRLSAFDVDEVDSQFAVVSGRRRIRQNAEQHTSAQRHL